MRTTQTIDLDLAHTPSAVRSPLSVIAGLSTSVWRVLRNRWAANRLHELDDRLLEDIGLTRRDVLKATYDSGVFDDPAALLVETARLRAKTRFERLRQV